MKDFKHEVSEGTYWLSKVSDSDYYDIEFYIDELSAKRKMNEYYNSVKDKRQEKGFRPGKTPRSLIEQKYAGKHGFYAEMFANYVNDVLLKTAPEVIIYTDDYQYRQMVNNEYVVTLKVWVEPKVEFKDSSTNLEEFISKLVIKTPKVDVDKLVNKRLDNFRKLHPTLQNKVDSELNKLPAEENDMVEVDIKSFIDGREFKEGCETSNIRLIPQSIKVKEMYDKLIGSKEGDSFVIETPTYGALVTEGNQLRLEVKVNHVYTCMDALVDDDLATTAGFDNLEKWRDYLKGGAVKVIERDELQFKRNRVLTELQNLFSVAEVPSGWVEQKVYDIVSQSRSKAIQANTISQLVSTRKQLSVLNYVGKILNIAFDDNNKDKSASMRDELTYANSVLSEVINRVTFEYFDLDVEGLQNGQTVPAA